MGKSEEFYLPCDGIKLRARLDRPESEKSPLLVFFHGLRGHLEEAHIQALARRAAEAGAAVLRVDLYGHGGSEGAFRDHTLYKWITEGLEVMDYARSLDFVTGLYVGGHSQGGLAAMYLAGMLREHIKGLVLLAPAYMIPDEARSGQLFGTGFDSLDIPDEIRIWEEQHALGGNYIRVAQMMHPEEAISRYQGPVLIVQGGADHPGLIHYSGKAAEEYADASLVLLKGETHDFEERTEEMAEAVAEFLTRRER